MKDKILFLDFDGVLFDTIMEVYLVNRYQYFGVDFLEEVDKKELNLYSKYKYLVYNIWMFYYYNPIIFGNTKEEDIIKEYSSAILKRDMKAEEKFCLEFLNIRKKLVENHYDFWKNLEVPYEFFFEIKKLYEQNNIDIVVASKKNKNSILERFSSYGFNLASDKVFAREFLKDYPSKYDFIVEYMEKTTTNGVELYSKKFFNFAYCFLLI